MSLLCRVTVKLKNRLTKQSRNYSRFFKMSPQFTIITPSYNKAKYIKDTIDSIHEQHGVTWEHIILDACSTDNTLSVVQPYLEQQYLDTLSKRGCSFRFIQEKDKGQSHAINKGLVLAKGDYVAWLNADDIYYENTLSQVKAFFGANPTAMLVYGEMNYLNADRTVLKLRPSVPFDRKFLLNNTCFIPQPSTFWRREVHAIAGLLDCKLHLAMDYEYWLRCSQFFHLHYVKATWSGLRLMADTKTGLSPTTSMPEALQIGQWYGANYFCPLRISYWMWNLGMSSIVRKVGRKILTGRRK